MLYAAIQYSTMHNFGIIKCEWVMQLKACQHTKYALVRVELDCERASALRSVFHVPSSTSKATSIEENDLFWLKDCCGSKDPRHGDEMLGTKQHFRQASCEQASTLLSTEIQDGMAEERVPKVSASTWQRNQQRDVCWYVHMKPLLYILFIDKIFWYFIDNV